MKNLAIIPARSGSKGLKHKNIKLLKGKPLIAYTIEAAKESNLFDEIMVSTDSEEYARIAREWGASVPFIRKEKYSTDAASSWDVVKDVLANYKTDGKEFDTVALLQPTSPLRRAEDIIQAYRKMEKKDANIVVGVCEVDHSPLWMNSLPKDFSLGNFIKKDLIERPRQGLSTYYRINGAIYIVKTDYLMNIKRIEDIYDDKSFAYIMSKEHSIDIDDLIDFKLAEILME